MTICCARCGVEVRDNALNYYRTPIGHQYYCSEDHYSEDKDRIAQALAAFREPVHTLNPGRFTRLVASAQPNTPNTLLSSLEAAKKADNGKPPLDLLDPLALEGIAAVLEFGRKKYAAHNWRSGFAWMRLMAALLRHAFAIIRGEDNDPESGLPHIDHLGCCWMFLSNMMKTRKDLDDRYRAPVSSSDAAAGSSTSAS